MVDAQFSTSKGFIEMLLDVSSRLYQDWDLHLIYILKHLYKLRLVEITSCEMVDAQFSTSKKGFIEMLWM
jgi:hypothetical protein